MKLLGIGLAALATAAAKGMKGKDEGSGDFSEKCSYLNESECGTTAGCKWSAEWGVCQEPKVEEPVEADRCTPLSKTDCQADEGCRYNREHGKPFFCEERDTRTKAPRPTKPTWDGVCSTLDKLACRKNVDCVYDRDSTECCNVGDPCPADVGCAPLDKKTCKRSETCVWDIKKEVCAEPATCGYECSSKTDKCCKKAMKDKEAGRADEDKCYLDKSGVKDSRCVDHTNCAQVTKKGWCKRFFKRDPWNCKWDKAAGVCYEDVEPTEAPYVEPETCEGKSKEDCAKYPDDCLPYSKTDGCRTFTGCDGLSAFLCKKMGCIATGKGETHECVSECPEGFSGDKCEIDDSQVCGDLSSSDADYNFEVVALRRVGDLGIVMDVSGSMATEIAGVKSGINAAASGCLDGEDAPYKSGVVMEYSDPSTRFLGKGNSTQFKAAVNLITRGMGKSEWGGDCPEVMFKGINACMAYLDDWSTIYAITDASAKDSYLAAGTTSTAADRHIRINFILTATCVKWYESPPFTGIHSVYPSTAAGTGGQVYQITKSSTLGPQVTAVIAAAAHDALAETDVAFWEFSGSTNDIQVDGFNHQTNFHISVVGANAGLSCTAENYDGAAIGSSDAHVIVDIKTVKTWAIPRISDAGRRLWRDSITCATSASASYTVTVRSGYEGCRKNWCENGGICASVDNCGLFTCDCDVGFSGHYCEESA